MAVIPPRLWVTNSYIPANSEPKWKFQQICIPSLKVEVPHAFPFPGYVFLLHVFDVPSVCRRTFECLFFLDSRTHSFVHDPKPVIIQLMPNISCIVPQTCRLTSYHSNGEDPWHHLKLMPADSSKLTRNPLIYTSSISRMSSPFVSWRRPLWVA